MAKANARARDSAWEPQLETSAALTGDEQAAASSAPDLDRIIHERMRLGLVSALAVNASLSFTELKKLLGTTDGNLSVHAAKLEDAGYITSRKYFDGRIPKTEYCLTELGRHELDRYLDHMEALIRTTRQR